MPDASTVDDATEPATAADMFARRLAADPDSAFLLAVDGPSWSFADIDARADAMADVLHRFGVADGDVIGLYQWNEPSWFVSVVAAWRLGAIAACTGAVSPPAEAVRRLTLVKPKVVVSSVDVAIGDWPMVLVDDTGAVTSSGLPEPASPRGAAVRPAADAPATVFFTSGTTGEAKAVIKEHHQLVEAARATASAYSRSPAFRPRMADESKPPALSFNPFGQAACFGRLIFRLYVGRPLVLIRKFDAEVVEQLAARYPLDSLQLTPAMVHTLAYTKRTIDLDALQYVTSGTAPLAAAMRDAFETRYGVPVLQAYGSTEGGVTALERYDDYKAGRRGPGSVGRITAESEWRIVDNEGNDVGTDVEGELLGRPKTVLLGDDGTGGLPLDADGWYHTGDLGRVDEHGILYLTGRAKDLVIVGGFNVHPGEVEEALRASPLVVDAVVVGLPDERLGEIAVGGIVWSRAAASGGDEAGALASVVAGARELLAPYKVPRRWFILDSVPLTPLGKPDRFAAARLAQQRATPLAGPSTTGTTTG